MNHVMYLPRPLADSKVCLSTIMLMVTNFTNTKKKHQKMTEMLAHGYSSKSSQWELFNEYEK